MDDFLLCYKEIWQGGWKKMKNKHLWLALGEGLLFMILFLHRYELEWMCWVQMLICIIIGIKVLDHLLAYYEDRRMVGKK